MSDNPQTTLDEKTVTDALEEFHKQNIYDPPLHNRADEAIDAFKRLMIELDELRIEVNLAAQN